MISRLKRAAIPMAVLGVGIGAVVVLTIMKPTPDTASEPPRALKVYVAPAEQRAAQLRVSTHGEVRARISSEVVAQVSGRIVEVSPEFVEGGAFNPGETLFRVEDIDYRLALNEAEARLAAARVDLEQALADADVARQQLAGQANPSPLALKKPQVARARAAIEAAEANLALAQTNLERTRVSLPYHGRITETLVDLGQFVTAGKVVAKAFGTDHVEIRLPLTDAQLGALGVPIGYSAPPGGGLPVDLTAQVAGKLYRWSGRVTRLDAAVDSATRVIYGTAEVSDPYGSTTAPEHMPLAVGLFVDANIAGRVIDQAIALPAEGLRAGDRVFVLNTDGQLEIRETEVIHQTAEQTVIASGVNDSELVIVSAIRNPIPGMSLEAIESFDFSQDGGAVEALAD